MIGHKLFMLAAAGAALVPLALAAEAAYPARPIQIVVAYPPGGGTDTLTRIVTKELGSRLGQSFLVVNKPGASGAIGATFAARAPADGYTLLMDTGTIALRPAIDGPGKFNPDDYVPVARVAEQSYALVVSASTPVKTVAELVTHAHTHPGKVNYASVGHGTVQYMLGELFKTRNRIDWTHVRYQGGAPAMNDLTAGRVQVTFSNTVPLMPFLQSGKVRVLAVTSRRRLEAMPEVPTMEELGYRDFGDFWSGIFAPRGTPSAIVSHLSDAVLEVMRQPEVVKALLRQGNVVAPMGARPFAKFIRSDIQRWTRVASDINYKPGE